MKNLPLRMPWGLFTTIKNAAKKNNRSMNKEIIHRLLESFKEN